MVGIKGMLSLVWSDLARGSKVMVELGFLGFLKLDLFCLALGKCVFIVGGYKVCGDELGSSNDLCEALDSFLKKCTCHVVAVSGAVSVFTMCHC